MAGRGRRSTISGCCCGLYLVEVASGPLSLLPRRLLRPIVRRLFYDGEPEAGHMADRAERVLLAAARAAAACASMRWRSWRLSAWLCWAHGSAWPVLLLALLGRAFVVSIMDNAPHYQGALADPDQGYDLRAPGPLATLVLNTNLHGTHHRHPNLPWTPCREAFRRDGERYAGSYLLRPGDSCGALVPLDASRSTCDLHAEIEPPCTRHAASLRPSAPTTGSLRSTI